MACTFGVHLPVMELEEEPNRESIISCAKESERLGFDSLSANDHLVFRRGWLDPLAALAAAASVTTKIRLGTSIVNLVVRNPVASVKLLTSIDILSSGRLFAGVGPGSHADDYAVVGIPFTERWGRFFESLDLLQKLWSSEEPVVYSGRYYKLDGLSLRPRPAQCPPPIMVGSWGSEIVLRKIARTGDGWMASAYNITPDSFSQKCKLLRKFREEVGRDADSFENSIMSMFCYISSNEEKVHSALHDVLSPALARKPEDLGKLLLFGSKEECAMKIRKYVEHGANRIHFWPVADYHEQVELLANEIIPSFT